MAQIFTISDGSTTINLLNATGPYFLAVYETGLNQWKNGGVFTDNQLTESSVPVFRQYDVFEEKLSLHITGANQNEVISNLRALFTLLDSGVEYFITGNGNQVYMSLKAEDESNIRYAVITGYRIEALPNPFAGTFVDGAKRENVAIDSLYQDVEIVLRRGLWLESPPETLTRAYLDSEVTFDSVTFGVDASNSVPVVLGNYRHESNITHIYRFDASAGTFSGNLISTSLPYNLFPSPMQVGDILYVGTRTSISNSGPFFNLIFNIGTASASDLEIAIEIPDGVGGWTFVPASVSFVFSSTGLVVVPISAQTATASVNSITAYWARFRINSMTTATIPTQTTRQVYSASNGYIDVQATNLAGDLDAIGRLDLTNYQNTTNNKILIGRKLYSKGANFTGYINFADEQNPSGISISLIGGSLVYATDTNSPSGRVIRMPAFGPDFTAGFRVNISNALAGEYVGKYRAFIRCYQESGTVGTLLGRLTVGTTASSGYDFVIYPAVELNYTQLAPWEVLDFGIIELPASSTKVGPSVHDIYIEFDVADIASNDPPLIVRAADLILIPADEVIMEITAQLAGNKTLVIDKVTSPEENVGIYTQSITSGGVITVPTYGGSDAIYLARERQRFWIFSFSRGLSEDYGYWSNPNIFKAELYKLNRYVLPRGSI